MEKIISDGVEFIDLTERRNFTKGTPSIWVARSVFIGMSKRNFRGSFAINDGVTHNGRTTDVLRNMATKLPCTVVLRMASGKKGVKASAHVQMLMFKHLPQNRIGIVLNGVIGTQFEEC